MLKSGWGILPDRGIKDPHLDRYGSSGGSTWDGSRATEKVSIGPLKIGRLVQGEQQRRVGHNPRSPEKVGVKIGAKTINSFETGKFGAVPIGNRRIQTATEIGEVERALGEGAQRNGGEG